MNTSSADSGVATQRVILKPRKAQPFFGRHPWVLNSAIAQLPTGAADGDVVDLCSDKGQFIARGLLNRRSRIQVRLYSWDQNQPLDHSFWHQRLERAIGLRRQLGLDDPQGAARLVFGESDGLSGIIIDRYGAHLVVQFNSLAMQMRQEELVTALRQLLDPASITFRIESGVAELEGLSLAAPAWGDASEAEITISEFGVQYRIDLQRGQKTGFYLDQRDNRRVAAAYMRDREVLDLFCYTGGFSLAAAALGGAARCLGIDSSERAIELARANAQLNNLTQVQFQRENCFQALDRLRSAGETFDAVVLDPPKFSRSRRQVDQALRAYFRINRLAVDLLRPDGILVTCSCTGNVMREDLLLTLSGVAQKSHRDIRVLEQRGPSADHPVSATCLDTDYLKCFICSVS